MKRKLCRFAAIAMAMSMTTSAFAATPRGTGDVDGSNGLTANDVYKILVGLANNDAEANVDGSKDGIDALDAKVLYNTILRPTTIVENVAVKVTTESAKGNVRTYEALANYQDELGTITATDEKGMTVIGSTYNIGATAAEVETLVDKDGTLIDRFVTDARIDTLINRFERPYELKEFKHENTINGAEVDEIVSLRVEWNGKETYLEVPVKATVDGVTVSYDAAVNGSIKAPIRSEASWKALNDILAPLIKSGDTAQQEALNNIKAVIYPDNAEFKDELIENPNIIAFMDGVKADVMAKIEAQVGQTVRDTIVDEAQKGGFTVSDAEIEHAKTEAISKAIEMAEDKIPSYSPNNDTFKMLKEVSTPVDKDAVRKAISTLPDLIPADARAEDIKSVANQINDMFNINVTIEAEKGNFTKDEVINVMADVITKRGGYKNITVGDVRDTFGDKLVVTYGANKATVELVVQASVNE